MSVPDTTNGRVPLRFLTRQEGGRSQPVRSGYTAHVAVDDEPAPPMRVAVGRILTVLAIDPADA